MGACVYVGCSVPPVQAHTDTHPPLAGRAKSKRALCEWVRSWPTAAPVALGSTGLWAVYAPGTYRVGVSAWCVAADQHAAAAARVAREALRDAYHSPAAVAGRARQPAEHLTALAKKKQQAEQARREKKRKAAELRREAAKQQRKPEAASQQQAYHLDPPERDALWAQSPPTPAMTGDFVCELIMSLMQACRRHPFAVLQWARKKPACNIQINRKAFAAAYSCACLEQHGHRATGQQPLGAL